jgi:cytochrome c oxidase subunit 4
MTPGQQTQTLPRLVAVYVALLVLLALTACSTLLRAGWWSTPISLTIAAAKTLLIASWFMNLRGQPGIVRIFAVAGLFWLMILLGITASDYLTRAWPG